MTHPVVLADFSPAVAAPKSAPAIAEDARLASYEEGYTAGWDDAASAEATAQARIGADFAKTLEDLSFTYHEARAHVLAAIGPLLKLMTEQVLPDLAMQNFAVTVVEAARAAIAQAADAPLTIVVNPDNAPALEKLLEEQNHLPLTLSEEPSLGPGQAYLRSSAGESAIDVGAVLEDIRTAVDGFLNDAAQEETREHA